MAFRDMPPGIRFLAQQLPKILTPPAFTFLAAWLLRAFQVTFLSKWLLFLAMVLSLPFSLTCIVMWNKYRVLLEAAQVGAVLPPTVPDRSPGGIASLLKLLRPGYLGQ